MPTVSPLAMPTSTCFTARTMPRLVENSTVRSATSSSGTASIMAASGAPLRIDDVAQPVAEQVEAEHRAHERGARKERDPPFARDHERGAFRHHDPPFGGRRTHAQADEGEAGGGENGGTHGQRPLHHHDRHDVRQNLSEQDADLALAVAPRRLHEARLPPDLGL